MKFLENPESLDCIKKWLDIEVDRVDAVKDSLQKIRIVDLTDMPQQCYVVLHTLGWKKEVKEKIAELEKAFSKLQSGLEKTLAKSNEETGTAKNKLIAESKKIKKQMRELNTEISHYTTIYRTF
jgi:uncharacterized phage infection (PIP) family protein YhgE